jgi:hypothetical protein
MPSVCRDFLPDLFFNLEDEGDIFLRNIGLSRTTFHHTPEEHTFQSERRDNIKRNENKLFAQKLSASDICDRLSQWSRCMRHELSLPAQTLGSWVRIRFEAWIFVYFYSVFVMSSL